MQVTVRSKKTHPLAKLLLAWLAIQTLSFTGLAAPLPAYPCQLAWNASADPSVTGYAIYYGSTTSTETKRLDVGTALSVTLCDLRASSEYFFYVVSYTADGIESLPSNVLYFTPSAVSAMHLDLLRNGAVRVQFEAATNTSCHVEYSSTLAPPQWHLLGGAVADSSGEVTVTDTVQPFVAKRFYRAVEP